jgi:hypothetical protein
MAENLQENKTEFMPQQSWVLQDLVYEVVQNDPEIKSEYTTEDLKKLLTWISNIDITTFAAQAIKWLLLELPKEEISHEILIAEIDMLKKVQHKERKNELVIQKNELVTEEFQSINKLYHTINEKYKPNIDSSERKIFASEKEKNRDLIKILQENKIDPLNFTSKRTNGWNKPIFCCEKVRMESYIITIFLVFYWFSLE